jgi:hypothetical protein
VLALLELALTWALPRDARPLSLLLVRGLVLGAGYAGYLRFGLGLHLRDLSLKKVDPQPRGSTITRALPAAT